MRINKRVAILAVLFFMLLFVCVCALSAQAASCTARVSWNANTEPDIAGYRVHVWRGIKILKTYDMGKTTAGQIRVVLPGNTRNGYITITAYDTSGNESEHSDRVPFRIPPRVK